MYNNNSRSTYDMLYAWVTMGTASRYRYRMNERTWNETLNEKNSNKIIINITITI